MPNEGPRVLGVYSRSLSTQVALLNDANIPGQLYQSAAISKLLG